jgi:hypothetical protein
VITHVGSRFVPEGGDGDLSGHCDSVTTGVDVELELSRVPAGFIFILVAETKN